MYLIEVYKSAGAAELPGADHRDEQRAQFAGMLRVDDRHPRDFPSLMEAQAVANVLRNRYGRAGYDFRPVEYPLLDFQL